MHTPRRGDISLKIQEALAHPPTFEDFTSALQTTKDSSAPGPSNITYGLIKQLPPVILQEVYLGRQTHAGGMEIEVATAYSKKSRHRHGNM